MNFILIPFFLAANVTVNDPAKWQYGLVSRFHANITLTMMGTTNIDLWADVSCRQRSINELICSSTNILMGTWILIKFSQRGIESFWFQQPIDYRSLNRARTIFEQLSIGADLLRHANKLPAFVARENHVLGDCDTFFTVLQYGEEDGCPTNNCDKKRNYELNVLSLPERRPGTTVVIEKRFDRKRCKNNSDIEVNDTIVTRDKTWTKMHIGLSTFTSQAKTNLKVKKEKMNGYFMVPFDIRVELIGIEPAKKELPNLSFEYVATLPYGEMLEHNFL